MSLDGQTVRGRRSTDSSAGDDVAVTIDGPAALELTGAESFTKSVERVVSYLNANTPLTDWSVSRVTRGEQIHVHVHHDEVLEVGDRVNWDESFCSRMAAGASHIVRNSRLDPNYSDLEASEQVGAYAGYSISDDRGEMFGVLCGVRVAPLSDEETIDEHLVRLFSDLLSSQLELARGVDRERRRIEMSETLAYTDALTGLLNRRGWDRLVHDAQERISGFGDPVAVAVIDLDNLKSVNDIEGHAAGDKLLQRASEALLGACTAASHVARFGGDEFVVLANGVVPSRVDEDFAVFVNALAQAGIEASIGYAAAEPGLVTVVDALAVADGNMYQAKRRKKSVSV